MTNYAALFGNSIAGTKRSRRADGDRAREGIRVAIPAAERTREGSAPAYGWGSGASLH
jgi:hypothetical protein